MGVREGRVDLYGPGVAQEGTLDVVHLLQGVAHVAVSVKNVSEKRKDFFCCC